MPGTRFLDFDEYDEVYYFERGIGGRSEKDDDATEYARIVEAISEGPILGLVDGLKSVYLDGTPVLNSDGTKNFTGLHLQIVSGTGSQAELDGFPSTENEISVGVKVSVSGGPVTRVVSTQGLDAIRVNISNPIFKSINVSDGSEGGSSAQIKIEGSSPNYLSSAWQTFTLSGNGVMEGMYNSKRSVGYRIDLPGDGPWTIKVTRMSADGDTYNLNETWWESYDEIRDIKTSYPWTACSGLMFNPAKFRSIPTRGYEVYGRIVAVPSNYNPSTRVYTGVWDGTFKQAWTDNPAWVWYDLATNSRYGAGAYMDPGQIDKWALYSIAQYCDVMVNDGKGGTEPRFTCNLYLTSREEAINVLQQVASIFRGIAYWSAGMVVPIQDAPSSPVALFSASNVKGGVFTYSGTARKARHTAALVAWNDPTDNYRQQIELVEDQTAIARYGYQPLEITALGCTSRGQARRAGLWALTTEQTETETVAFTAGLEGTGVGVGTLIQVQDPFRAGKIRAAGRVLASTATSISIDQVFTLQAGKTYRVYWTDTTGVIRNATVTNASGDASTLTMTSQANPPGVDAQWQILEIGSETAALYRVVNVAERDGIDYEVTAVQHNPLKYSTVESGVSVPVTTARPGLFLRPPTGLTVSTGTRVQTDRLVQTINGAWTGSANAVGYTAAMSRDNGPWVEMRCQGPSASAEAIPGAYRVRVAAIYVNGISGWTEASLTVPVSSAVPGLVDQALDNAASAQSTADAAVSAASAAQSSANAANALLSDISSDGKLTPQEKQQARKEWDALSAEKAGIDYQADAFVVSRVAYDNAFQGLANYLNAGTTWSSGVPSWLADSNLGTTTTIIGSTFRSTWATLYTERQALLNAISSKAKALADAAQSSANTAQSTADAAVSAAAAAAPIVVSALPAIGTVPEGKLAWVTGSSPARMYQARGGAWVELGVQASAIFGQLVAGQLSAGIIASLISSGEVIYTSNFAAHTGGTSYTGSSLGTTTPATVDAGALLRNGGSGQPPLLVASDGMLVGSTLIGEALLRTLSMFSTNGGSVAGGTWRAFYRGNSTGAPVAARLKITPLIATSDSARQIAEWELVVQPTATTDNLDALSYVEMEFYWPSYSTSGPYATRRYGIGGRNYYTLSQEDQALNAVYGHAVLTHASVKPETSNAYQGYIRARLVGVQGPGDWLWYSPGSNGTPITGSTSTPSALSGAPASGGGSTGSGGKVIQPQI